MTMTMEAAKARLKRICNQDMPLPDEVAAWLLDSREHFDRDICNMYPEHHPIHSVQLTRDELEYYDDVVTGICEAIDKLWLVDDMAVEWLIDHCLATLSYYVEARGSDVDYSIIRSKLMLLKMVLNRHYK